MSSPFPKSKEKRPRSPSEPNKSFVKNVTSRMSGLLPATITKWFSSPSSSNTNGSAPVADATDSSTEDEAPESPTAVQPPAKKIRLNAPGEFSQQVPVETRCTSTNTESIDEIYTAHSPIGRSNSRGNNICTSTRIHSSIDDTTEETAQDNFYKSQHSISAIEQSVTKKRKSLFGTHLEDSYKSKNESKSSNVRDPYFKPSLLSSPFYAGRTMYGGASSSYLSPSSFKKKKISVTNETSNNDSVNMSQSARRVMDLLEHYSSPLIEAKRIPQITKDPEKLRIDNSLQKSVSPYNQNVYSYKTQELYVPSIASILTIKRKSRLMDTTSAARQIMASHSSSSEFSPYPLTNSEGDRSHEVSGDKLTTKVKSRLTRTNRERNIETETTTSDTVNLPNVVLQIDKDNLPKFTFGPISTSQASSSSIQTPVIITPEALKKNTESDKSDKFNLQYSEKDKPIEEKNDNKHFKFMPPVTISTESISFSITPPKLSFSSPDRQVSISEKVEEVKPNEEKLLPSNTSNQINLDNKLPVPKSDWKCLDCWVMNKTEVIKCVCCSGKKPVECDDGKKCSDCNVSISQSQSNKCTECEKKTMIVNNPFVSHKEAKRTKWSCKDCWVDNEESAEKCVCCGGKNPNKIKSPALNNPDIMAESEWRCNDCWIKNKGSLSKCAACGGSKPGTQTVNYNNFGNNAMTKDTQGANKAKETVDGIFINITKSQSQKWECPLCLVRNESNRDTCICCDASKPGTEKETQKFNFHQPSEITFKFGIQLKNQEKCADIEPEECNMGEESETNNNVLPKTMFNFGLPVKKTDDQTLSMDKLAETPKMNFTFGVPNIDQTSPVSNNIFGIPNRPIETSKAVEENPQEVPQVFTHPQSNEQLKKNIGLFNSPVKSQVAPEMPALVPLHLMNQNVKKDVSFLNPSVMPTTSSEAKTQQKNFTFPSIMPASNVFSNVPATTTAVSNILPGSLSMSIPPSTSISIFQKPNVVTTAASSFFQKSDSIPAMGGSLFPNTEGTTTTTTSTSSVPMGTMQPVFSFGGQGTAPQAEKPKFSFNFSSNKTDSASIFNPTFGTSVSNIPSNKFNLPSNPVIGGNSISGNPLNNTTQMNPLSTGNCLPTPSGPSMFGATVLKENMWSSTSNNLFGTNSTTNGDQKPQAFTFGTSTQFNANSTIFGSPARQTPSNNVPFGSTTQTQPNNPPFGSNVHQAQTNNNDPFGTTTQQAQPSNTAFGSTAQQAQPPAAFGSTTQQPQPTAVFGSTTQQAQPPAVFGSTTQQPQPPAAFGSTTQQPQSPAAFGSTTQQTQPNTAFGSTTQQTQPPQPPQNVFGIGIQTTTSQPMFGNLQSQTTPNIFGGIQVPNNPMPMGMFGNPNQAVPPSFGALNPSIPTFEASTLPPLQPTPASFNFGGQTSTGIFGFGQQQQQLGQAPSQPENQPGMYSFGAPPVAAPQMQFTIGSAPNTNVRRVRKAMRRTQR